MTKIKVVLIVLLFMVIPSLFWLAMDSRNPYWDQSYHALSALKYYRLITEQPIWEVIKNFLTVEGYFPPFYYLSSLPFIALFGFSEDSIVYTNFLYALLLGFSVFSISRKFTDELGAYTSVALVFLAPMLLHLSQQFMLDFPLTAMIAFAHALLLNEKVVTHKRFEYFFGALLGCLLLLKWTALAYVLPCMIYVLIFRSGKGSKFLSLLKIGIACLLIAMPWYAMNFERLSGGILNALNSGVLEKESNDFWVSLMTYLVQIGTLCISKPLLYLYFLGWLLFLVYRPSKEALFYLLLWILPAFICFLIITNKDIRFMIPILPPILIMGVIGISRIPFLTIRKIVCLLMVTIGSWQIYAFLFQGATSRAENPYLMTMHYSTQKWDYSGVLQVISKDITSGRKLTGVIVEHEEFNPNSGKLYACWNQMPFDVEGFSLWGPVDLITLSKFDYLIVKSGRIFPAFSDGSREKLVERIQKEGAGFLGFQELGRRSMPDGSVVLILKREVVVVPEVDQLVLDNS